jgi:hypothetical protein
MTVITLKKLQKIVSHSLVEWLSAEGFAGEDGVLGGGCVLRWQGDIYTNIGCEVIRIGGVNRIVPFGQMGFLHAQKIYTHFMADSPEDAEERNQRAVDFQVGYPHYMKDWNAYIACQHEEEVEAALATLKAFIFDYLYPMLTAYTTPEKLLPLYQKIDENNPICFNIPVWHGYSSALGVLILARLHKPALYAEFKKRYQPILYDPLEPPSKLDERADRLIAYLDQNELTPL